jgi:hypothetical protein
VNGDEKRYTATSACQSSGACLAYDAFCDNQYAGWVSATAAACGTSASYVTSCGTLACPAKGAVELCSPTSLNRTQSCR